MATLIDSVKGMMTDAVIDKASSFLGMESSSMSSSMGKFLPAIIGGLISKGGNESGAGMLLDLIKSKNLTDLGTDDLLGVLGDKDKAGSMLDMGGDLLGSIFGNNQSGILEKLIGMTGLKKAGGSMLLKFLAPIVLRKIGGMVMKNGWGANKLSSYMNDQKSSIAGLIPGMSGLLGFADKGKEMLGNAGAKATAAAESVVNRDEGSGGGGWWKWLLPLILIGGVAWFLTKDGCNKTAEMDETEMTSDDASAGSLSSDNTGTATSTTTTTTDASDKTMEITTETTDTGNMSWSGLSDNGDILGADGNVLYKGGSYGLDADGNLVGNKGNILVQAANVPASMLEKLKGYLGKYSGTKLKVDDNGNLVDSAGKVIFKKGEYTEKNGFFYDMNGNKLGKMWSKIVAAVKETADAGIDAMKELFSGLATKKAGAKTEYALSNIEFNEEGNRITNFSKSEVEGLAAALKENESGKIVVRAYTNDGKNEKANKRLSKSRAQVVHDMLVTLGVSKSQISVKGMGDGDNKVEITASE